MYILTSNIFNIFITCAIGCGLLIVPNIILMRILKCMAVIICSFIIISYLFNYGETVHVFKYYKRSFSVFGDSINIPLIFLFFIFLVNKKHIYYQLCFIAFLMAFGKMALILMFICFVILLIMEKEQRRFLARRFMISFIISILIYFIFAEISHQISDYSINNAASHSEEEYFLNPLSYERTIYEGRLYQNCNLCVITNPLRKRMMSWVAGVWMTSQGGFASDEYVFADLIYNSNPYNVNEILDVTYDEWDEMRVVSNAFLGIGSSYGPIVMILLISFIGFVLFIGWKNHKTCSSYSYHVCLAYFTTIVVFDQTHQYIQAYNDELILLSFCGAYIIKTIYIQKKFSVD